MSEFMSDEHRQFTKSRALHDAELIKGGAEITFKGVLLPTNEQIAELREDAFGFVEWLDFCNTQDSEIIEEHFNYFSNLEMYLARALGRSQWSAPQEAKQISAMKQWGKDNDIAIDWDTLFSGVVETPEESMWVVRDREQVDYIELVYNSVHQDFQDPNKPGPLKSSLMDLREQLIRHPHIRTGNAVSVMRPDGSSASDWKVSGILANGTLKVSPQENRGTGYMHVSADVLLEWNPKPEEETSA